MKLTPLAVGAQTVRSPLAREARIETDDDRDYIIALMSPLAREARIETVTSPTEPLDPVVASRKRGAD